MQCLDGCSLPQMTVTESGKYASLQGFKNENAKRDTGGLKQWGEGECNDMKRANRREEMNGCEAMGFSY